VKFLDILFETYFSKLDLLMAILQGIVCKNNSQKFLEVLKKDNNNLNNKENVVLCILKTNIRKQKSSKF